MIHKMPELPFAPEALAPRMSAETISFHFGKHLQTYMDNVNRLVAGTDYEDVHLRDIIRRADGPIYNNAAQAWNHILFFRQLTPEHQEMSSNLTQQLAGRWGSVDEFKRQLKSLAVGLFGSGWVWLARDNNGELQLLAMPNAGNPLTLDMSPIMCVDVWEHAYYLDYQNRRGDYVDALFQILNWDYIEERMMRKDATIYY